MVTATRNSRKKSSAQTEREELLQGLYDAFCTLDEEKTGNVTYNESNFKVEETDTGKHAVHFWRWY